MTADLAEMLKIVLLCIVAAVLYGIMHDQVTARICVEYFTIGHPPVFNTDSPTLLAFGWGIIATWWVGVLLGFPAAFASRVGSWPKFDARQLVRPIAGLLMVMAIGSFMAGVAGYFMAKAGTLTLFEPMTSKVPAAKHVAFLTDAAAHLAAYGVGILGGLVLCGWILARRRTFAQSTHAFAR